MYSVTEKNYEIVKGYCKIYTQDNAFVSLQNVKEYLWLINQQIIHDFLNYKQSKAQASTPDFLYYNMIISVFMVDNSYSI